MSVPDPVAFGTARGRWVLIAAVLGSGIAFLDGSVVNAALPAIARDFDAGVDALQWTLTAYLLTQGSLLVLGGSLGDLYGRRRVFVYGLIGFAFASLLCAISQSSTQLEIARALQGVAAAALVPGSLALLSSSFRVEDRGRAIGAWSGLAGVATAAAPFLGGFLIDSVSWRLVFVINLPLVLIAVVITMKWVPESRDDEQGVRIDVLGAVTLSIGLAGVVYALIEGPAGASTGVVVAAAVVGGASLVAFFIVEARQEHPMVPLTLFKSRQFSGANLVTLAVYAALGITTFLVVVHLQTNLGYSALEAGAALLPITFIMLVFSARSGALAQRIGPRLPMTVGPCVVGVALLLLSRIEPGTSYVDGVLPGMVVLGAGLAVTVAPLTATVLASVDDHHMGIASAINNAASRIASLLAIAVLPGVTGLSEDFDAGYQQSLVIAAVLAVIGGIISWITIRTAFPVRSVPHVPVGPSCHGSDTRRPQSSVAA
ncbi:MAG TPA: MFS transporter [Acidimicrobiales bacterium]|jgi:EmrB/QacA subfamily drug resistance transporter|nr:MFS transporter [Acidimicrobiales bacterium]